MKQLPLLRICLLFALAAALLTAPVGAGKPKPPPPPPPPTPGPEVYEWRPDLGGWLDTSNNLVWGYSMVAIVGGAAGYDFASSFAQDYEGWMASIRDDFNSLGDDAEGAEEAEEYYYWADVCDGAAAHSNWRLPTLDEATNAVAKGLFTYGPDGFNSYCSTPAEAPGIAYGDIFRWSSTLSSNKKQGFTRHWVWKPLSGGTGEAPNGYSNDAIVVRTHTP